MSTSSQNQPAQTQAPLPPERLAEIGWRLSAEGLTPGPWTLDYESCDCSDGLCRHGSYVTAVITSEVKSIAAERIERTGEAPRDYDFHRTEMPDFTDADWELMAHAREDVPALLAEVERLQKLEKTVTEFLAERAETITAIRNCHPDNSHDYNRWQGHAESRRNLSERLGLPVAWPEDGAS